MKITTPGNPLKGKDIVRSNLVKNIDNVKALILEQENLQREVLFILDRYPNHREWKTVAGHQAKSFLNSIRSEVRAVYKEQQDKIPSDEDISSDMMALANKNFYGRLSMLHVSLETSEEYLAELKNL
ncbi:hypothetical protein ACQR3P_28700 [Rhodococcus sp. IEGM1300]